jgi:hypothetical protein
MTASIALLAAALMLKPEPVPADVVWMVSGGFCEPETVLPLPDDTLLISNVCGFQQPGSGFLTLLGSDGSVIDWRIVEQLDAPLGMALMGDRLFVIDSNRVRVFGWPDYRQMESIELDAEVANDIAVARDGTMYVSDTAGGKVIRIAADGSQSVLTGMAQFPGANGIHVNGDVLYVGGSRLWRVDLRDHSVVTVGPQWLGDVDGIEMERTGTLQISPVGGPLVRFCNSDSLEILAGDGISSANHGWAPGLRLALIPTGFDNTVIAIRINDRSPPQAAADKPSRACSQSFLE